MPMDAREFRELLLDRLDDIVARQTKLQAHLHNRDRTMPRDSQDAAQFLENDEVLEALDDLARAEIGLVREALHRVDEGTWNVCTRCGEDIGPRRLSIIPTTSLCVTCAAEVGASR